MSLYLYNTYPPSSFTTEQKMSSVHRQWMGMLLYILQFLPILFILFKTKQNINLIDLNFLSTSPFWIIYMFTCSLLAVIGQIWIILEIIKYKVVWLGRSFLNQGKFWNNYEEIGKPISLLVSLIPSLMLIMYGVVMVENNFAILFNLK